jgi:hypothetical protein
MQIINCNSGRLGNSIFRMFANIVFLIVYDINGSIVYDKSILHNSCNNIFHVNEHFFLNWSNKILNGTIPPINNSNIFYFNGYYQHDNIYSIHRQQIIDYIKNHPELLLMTDRNDKYIASDLIQFKINKKYSFVVHLRLEDFLITEQVISPISLSNVIDCAINKHKFDINQPICFVVNKPEKELEFKYIDFFKNKYNIILESNDPMTDYNIMKHADLLVCSYSTLSWCAAFLSDTAKDIYIPDYKNSTNQTFKNIPNSSLYDIEFCNVAKLKNILG